MQIPQYWAQERLRHQTGIRHGVTVQRWGWSEHSQQDARNHAQQRAQQALDAALHAPAERNLPPDFERMEWMGEYGLDGCTPIREEVLERRGPLVMTRNSYGAQCLNTEQVAIADMDFPPPKKPPRFPIISTLLLAIALAVGHTHDLESGHGGANANHCQHRLDVLGRPAQVVSWPPANPS